VHWVFTLIEPVCQFGEVPPWQLTFEQLSPAELNDDAPDSALYVARNATSPGDTRDLARL
jgi:hypothetical protein